MKIGTILGAPFRAGVGDQGRRDRSYPSESDHWPTQQTFCAPAKPTSWARTRRREPAAKALTGPGKCLRKICAAGDATASHLEKPNHLMIRNGCGIQLQADSKPLRAMRCHARMALVVSNLGYVAKRSDEVSIVSPEQLADFPIDAQVPWLGPARFGKRNFCPKKRPPRKSGARRAGRAAGRRSARDCAPDVIFHAGFTPSPVGRNPPVEGGQKSRRSNRRAPRAQISSQLGEFAVNFRRFSPQVMG